MAKSSQKAIKYTHLEHVLKVPDTYVGSIETTSEEHYVLDDTTGKMTKKTITYTPGEYKIFDEILVNALDHYVRIKEKNIQGHDFQPVKNIKVSFDIEWSMYLSSSILNLYSYLAHPSENFPFLNKIVLKLKLASGNSGFIFRAFL